MEIEIPKNVENLQLPDPCLISYFRNIEDRKIWLETELDETWLEYERMILKWNKEDDGVPVEERKRLRASEDARVVGRMSEMKRQRLLHWRCTMQTQ